MSVSPSRAPGIKGLKGAALKEKNMPHIRKEMLRQKECLKCLARSRLRNISTENYNAILKLKCILKVKLGPPECVTDFFLFLNQNVCYGYSKEPSQ